MLWFPNTFIELDLTTHKIYSCVDFQNHRNNTKQLEIWYRFSSDIYLLKYLFSISKERREGRKKEGIMSHTSQNLISVGNASVNAIKWNKQEKAYKNCIWVMTTIFKICSSGCILSHFSLHLIQVVRGDDLPLSDVEARVK